MNQKHNTKDESYTHLRIIAEQAKLIQRLVDALSWYVEEDDTMEGGQWDIDNAPWIEGRNEAISILAAANEAGFKPSDQ